MLYAEFNWTANAWQCRFGHTFTDIRGVRSWEKLADLKADLAAAHLQLGRKTDSRTYKIESAAFSDSHYSIAPEFCGHASARFVLRFCGDFLGSFETDADARNALIEHDARRLESA